MDLSKLCNWLGYIAGEGLSPTWKPSPPVMTLKQAAHLDLSLAEKLQGYKQFFSKDAALTSPDHDIVLCKGNTGYHLVTWCLVSFIPYSSAGDNVGGFTEPLDGSRWAGKQNFELNQFDNIIDTNIRLTKAEKNNPETAQYDVFPLKISDVQCYAYHDSGSGICCHPEKMRRMLQARNPNDVKFVNTVLTRIKGFQGEPVLHNTHIYCFTFQVGKTRPPIRICSQELADGMANLDTFLISRDVLWGENWNGLQDVLSDGSICP